MCTDLHNHKLCLKIQKPLSHLQHLSLQVCTECLKTITMGSVYIFSERVGPDKQWHPQCFRSVTNNSIFPSCIVPTKLNHSFALSSIRCNTCHELLVDLVHFQSPEHDGLYCGRHHVELLLPRCAGCDEVKIYSHDGCAIMPICI